MITTLRHYAIFFRHAIFITPLFHYAMPFFHFDIASIIAATLFSRHAAIIFITLTPLPPLFSFRFSLLSSFIFLSLRHYCH
jgi:hypothetical protein